MQFAPTIILLIAPIELRAPKMSSRYFDQIEPITPMTGTFLISKKPKDIIRQGF